MAKLQFYDQQEQAVVLRQFEKIYDLLVVQGRWIKGSWRKRMDDKKYSYCLDGACDKFKANSARQIIRDMSPGRSPIAFNDSKSTNKTKIKGFLRDCITKVKGAECIS